MFTLSAGKEWFPSALTVLSLSVNMVLFHMVFIESPGWFLSLGSGFIFHCMRFTFFGVERVFEIESGDNCCSYIGNGK